MSDASAKPIRTSTLWTITLLSLLTAASLIAMPFLAGPPDGGKMPDLVRFFGRFHPVLLHLPIGVFALILLQELGAIFGKRGSESRQTGLFPMFFGAASAVLAVIAGFLLYHGGGYEGNDLAERHLWGGLSFAVAALLTFIVKAWTISRSGNPAFFRTLLFGSVAAMGFTSHDGASMTHGSDYLTQYAPDPVRKMLGLEPKTKPAPAKPLEEQIVYTDIVAPIFERRCIQCHKEGNSKGRYRMDTYELLVKGGKEGDGLEPGDAESSNIIYRIDLPEDDDEHMPPEGKPQLTAQEIEIIKWWIDTGADPAKTVGELQPETDLRELLAQLIPSASTAPTTDEETSESAEIATAGIDPALQATVDTLAKEFPGALTFESRQSPLLTFTAVSMRGNLGDEDFLKLQPVLPHLVTLDLSATRVTDEATAGLASATQLRLIRLAETAITDTTLDTLVKLPSLESVNLYGTKVSDAGVLKLAALPNLKRLYLWQTDVSEQTISTLREKLPACEIITGI